MQHSPKKVSLQIGEKSTHAVAAWLAWACIRGCPVQLVSAKADWSLDGRAMCALSAFEKIAGARISGSTVDGNSIEFEPPAIIEGGEFVFDTAKRSACDLLLDLVPVLLCAQSSSKLRIHGRNYGPLGANFDFVERAWLPLAQKMGAKVEIHLEKVGFAEDGVVTAQIIPSDLQALHLLERGQPIKRKAEALVSQLPGTIAIRELRELREILELKHEECLPRIISSGGSLGNVLVYEETFPEFSNFFTEYGSLNRSAELVAQGLAQKIQAFQSSKGALETALARALIPLLLLAGGQVSVVDEELEVIEEMRDGYEAIGGTEWQVLESPGQRLWTFVRPVS